MCRGLLLTVLVLLHAAPACAADSTPSQSTTRPATLPTAGVAAPVIPAKDITLRDVTGIVRKPLDPEASRAKAGVVFFLSHDCPISNSYAPEINRITSAYGGEGKFTFSVVHPYAELTPSEAMKHAKEFNLTVPVFVDTTKVLTERAGARVTPEVAVIDAAGRVLYRGRIDDKWVDYGKGRPEPTVRDLRNALDAILAGRPVPVERTDAVGCPI
jgi:hypothetical protein